MHKVQLPTSEVGKIHLPAPLYQVAGESPSIKFSSDDRHSSVHSNLSSKQFDGAPEESSSCESADQVTQQTEDHLHELYKDFRSRYLPTSSAAAPEQNQKWVTWTSVLAAVTKENKRTIDHVWLLMEGYEFSIVDYIGSEQNTVLKVTTSHHQVDSLCSAIAEINKNEDTISQPRPKMVVLDPQEESGENLLATKLQNHGVKVDHIAFGDKTQFYRFGKNIEIETERDLEELDLGISAGQGKDKDSVIGCLTIDSANVDNSHQILGEEAWRKLSLLDCPYDESPVTVVVMSKLYDDGRTFSIFQLLAGDLKQDCNKRVGSLEVLTMRLTNDELSNKINEICEENLFSKLTDDHVKKEWLASSSAVIVTKDPPTYDDDDEIVLNAIKPEFLRDKYDKYDLFSFKHPEKPDDLFIQTTEPRSPPKSFYGGAFHHQLATAQLCAVL